MIDWLKLFFIQWLILRSLTGSYGLEDTGESVLGLPQCGRSTGVENQLYQSIMQTMETSQCSISPPEYWPRDYGETALNEGIFYSISK